jgi:hypothetical protein
LQFLIPIAMRLRILTAISTAFFGILAGFDLTQAHH